MLFAARCHAPCTGRCAKSVGRSAAEAIDYVAECRVKVSVPDWNGRCAYQSAEMQTDAEMAQWGLDIATPAEQLLADD